MIMIKVFCGKLSDPDAWSTFLFESKNIRKKTTANCEKFCVIYYGWQVETFIFSFYILEYCGTNSQKLKRIQNCVLVSKGTNMYLLNKWSKTTGLIRIVTGADCLECSFKWSYTIQKFPVSTHLNRYQTLH